MANINTPKFRVSYPKVFKAEKNNLSGENEYSVQALFAKGADLSPLIKAAKDAMEKKWGADKSKWPKNIRTPFRDQAERAKVDEATGKKIMPPGYEEGAIFINLKSKQRPGVVDQNVQDIIDETQFYAGCYAIASVSVYAYDAKGNRGVSFGLGNIQKVADGEPFGSRSLPQNDFAPIENVATESGSASAANLFD
jgi:hypothetical protein